MKRIITWMILICLLLMTLTACGTQEPEVSPGTLPVILPEPSVTEPSVTEPSVTEPAGRTEAPSEAYTNPPTRAHESRTPAQSTEAVPITEAPAETTTPEATTPEATAPVVTEASTVTEAPTAPPSGGNGFLVCLDAGHQGQANTDKEPLGPGSSEMKTKVSTGTQGRTTGVPEYVVNLQVALKLQQVLEARGYEVLMIRTTHDINISNAERAKIANDAKVDAFVRIHCNGVDDTSVNGLLAMIQTPDNPWNGAQYAEFKRLAQCIVDEACAVTGAKNMGLLETDGMTGINWCERPTALVEMGFMTNPEEDAKLVDDHYQDLLAEGIANGLDKYFGISR